MDRHTDGQTNRERKRDGKTDRKQIGKSMDMQTINKNREIN
jgi:hypothetical protein